MPIYRTYNNQSLLCCTVNELIECGISNEYIWKALNYHRNGKLNTWPHHKEGRSIYLHFDGLADQYKNLITQLICGGKDPHSISFESSIQSLLNARADHAHYFDEYRLPDGRHLPPRDKSSYIEACRWMELILLVRDDVKFDVGRFGFKSKKAFFQAVTSFIAAKRIKLPTNYRRLMEKVEQYKIAGPESVIKHNYGNANTAKVNPEMRALIRQVASQSNQFPIDQIVKIVNHTGLDRGWPVITAQTVRNYINEIEVKSFREGIGQWRNAFDFIVKRFRPSQPNLLWVGDGTPMELFYQECVQDSKNHQIIKYWKRKMVYIITDAFNDFIVGYATGESESAELARIAWKQACISAESLPHQIKVDNFAISKMRPFYEAIALNKDYFTPAAVGNARDKTVEQSFAKLNNLVLRRFKNYAGANITAKHQPNRDFLSKIRHQFPDESGVLQQIDIAIWAWNNSIRDNGKSLFQEWKEADRSRDRKLSDIKRLQLFGQIHSRGDMIYQHRLTNAGIRLTIEGITHNYMEFEPEFFVKNAGKEFQVIYDEWDLNKILITADEGSTNYLVNRVEPVPMAFADMQDGDRTRLNRILDMKKNVKGLIMDMHDQDRNLLSSAGIDPARSIEAEGYAKGMFPVGNEIKGMLNESNNLLKAPTPEIIDEEEDFYVKIAKNNIYNIQLNQLEDNDE
jgi:hypothetical protein